MQKFTDLLDNYLLALGEFNQAYAAYGHDALKFGEFYRESEKRLMSAKEALNVFFDVLIMSPVVSPNINV